jgi:two-component system chemotaxis response regulator CheV
MIDENVIKNEHYHDDIFKDEFDDDDEIDLLKLVSNSANDLNQYLIFKGSNEEWFAMNVSKIEEIMVYSDDINIVHNSDANAIIYGTADIRNIMTTLIYFDDWFGNTRLDDSEYELIVLANYGGHKMGIIVKEVASIITIEASKMSDNSLNNEKTTFITKVLIESEEQMCTIYDGDKMLLDIFDKIEEQSLHIYSAQDRLLLSKKTIYFADDSKFVRNIVEKLFSSLEVNYKIFNDGLFLVEYLKSHPNAEVDLFITDLEMPKMGGREVITAIREDQFYTNTPILVHTNMSNSVMNSELIKIGANDIIAKINLIKLGKAIIGAVL